MFRLILFCFYWGQEESLSKNVSTVMWVGVGSTPHAATETNERPTKNVRNPAGDEPASWGGRVDPTYALFPTGGFKYLLFSPLFGEDSHFDWYFSDGLKPPTRQRFSQFSNMMSTWTVARFDWDKIIQVMMIRVQLAMPGAPPPPPRVAKTVKMYETPAFSKWPFDNPNGGHWTPEKVT